MQYYVNVIKNYATFSGRARRKEYWMFVLFNILFSFAASLIDRIAGLNIAMSGISIGILSSLYSLFILIPSIAVIVRRLHDTNRSGGWFFIGLIPLIGWIVLIVFYCTEGTRGNNKYGADPKN